MNCATAESHLSDIQAKMVECGICLEEYQEGNLELHLQTCVPRLMFRCSLCDGDYVNKEGLWNHLDIHEIADESKELHYQEIKAKHILHQCVLCNDQRAYSESSHWRHVHDVHDGFFLRCSDCGEKFRSEQLKNEHACSRCEVWDETVASDFNALKKGPVPIAVENRTSDADHLELTRGEQSGIANEELNNGLDVHSQGHLNYNIIEKEPASPTINSTKSKDLPSQFACDICGATFSSKGQFSRHMKIKYTCMEGGLHKCPYCRRVFRLKEYQAHITLCEKRKYPCELCSMKFTTSKYLGKHMKNIHSGKGILKNAKQDQKQVKNIMEKNTTSSLNSSPNSNVDDEDTGTGKKDIADEGVQQPSSRSSGSSSGTKCLQCGKECVRASCLRLHIVQMHQPTECSICAITFEGTGKARYHRIKCHLEPKYECPTCGKKFHRKAEFNVHCFRCQGKRYLCKLCGKKIKLFRSGKLHNERFHPDERSTENIQIVQEQDEDNELEMEITAGESMISARDDQGQSNSRSNERSSANLNDEEFMDGQMNDKDSRMLSVAPLNGSSERQDILEKTSQSLVENRYSCNICGIIFQSYSTFREHKLKKHKRSMYQCPHCTRKFFRRGGLGKHVPSCADLKYSCELCGAKFNLLSYLKNHKTRIHHSNRPLRNANIEGADCTEEQKQISVEKLEKQTRYMYQCPHCTRKFYNRSVLEKHVPSCADLKYSCELCGAKFNFQRQVEDHKKRVHHGSRPLRDENIEGADCTEEQKQISVEKVDAAQEVTSCIICRIAFASTDELTKHKLHCTNHGKDHDDPQFGAKENSLLHDVKGTQNDSTTAMQDENIDLEMEIKVEETMLQEQEYQHPGRSFATILDPHDSESKDVEADDADDLEKGIKVKEECLEDEEKIETDQQTSTECHEEPIDQNESRVRHEVMDVHSKEAKKNSHPQRRKLPLDYTERRSSKRIRVKTKKLNC